MLDELLPQAIHVLGDDRIFDQACGLLEVLGVLGTDLDLLLQGDEVREDQRDLAVDIPVSDILDVPVLSSRQQARRERQGE